MRRSPVDSTVVLWPFFESCNTFLGGHLVDSRPLAARHPHIVDGDVHHLGGGPGVAVEQLRHPFFYDKRLTKFTPSSLSRDMPMPDACANIAKNPCRTVARYLNRAELERLGAVLDKHQAEHPWPVSAIRLLTLSRAWLSEAINLRWDEIGELPEDAASARLEDSKTGPRTVWLGPHAAWVFPDDLTSDRLYTFWTGIREETGLPCLRIHDAWHIWASQGLMNGVGRLLGHCKRTTTTRYAHLDNAALRAAAPGRRRG